jgi:KUP system potassium uptake protein
VLRVGRHSSPLSHSSPRHRFGPDHRMRYAYRVTELSDDEDRAGGKSRQPETDRPVHRSTARGMAGIGVMVTALGVVFGDIGTSPLYALQTVFSIDHGDVRATPGDVYGVISLVFWSITVVVSLKYVTFILRADNDGEGGVMALAALLRRALGGASGRRAAIVMAVGVFGASLFYGDSVITPAISVLSAVEGLKVATPSLSHLVVPIAAAILAVLFIAQRWGTTRIGSLFGPVMLVWFLTLAVTGLREVIPHPAILRGLSPSYAAAFVTQRPYVAFIALGAVVLAITGAEALYADMGHFGPRPIRLAWFVIVFPALTLNYLAQGALIVGNPATRENPFFLLAPSWAQIPMVILATLATVIASQSVISGAFSVSRQAVRLGFLPHLRIRHTSAKEIGQVYVPAVNWVLFACVLAVTIGFGSATRLATAYGVAVTATFLVTTTLFLVLARTLWRWAAWKLALGAVVFGIVEVTYFAANLTKIIHGGWLPLLIAGIVFTIMTTWQRGRQLVTIRRTKIEGTLSDFITEISIENMRRTPGTAVYPHLGEHTAPLALRLCVEHNHALHEQIIIVSAQTADVPNIPWQQRLRINHLGNPSDGIVHIAATFGFQDRSDVPQVLHRANADALESALDPDGATYFLSRITLHRTHQPGMNTWRKHLFIALAHNATNPADYLCLPTERTVIMGSHLDL